MKLMFVDTAGWVAAADASDPKCDHTRKCRDSWIENGGILLTTDQVCSETLTVMRFRLGINIAEKWWEQIGRSSRVQIETLDPIQIEKSRLMFFRYKDKDFSFIDCTSFIIMKELKITCALTLDDHFRQMGFEIRPN